jgi:hypothetical protein
MSAHHSVAFFPYLASPSCSLQTPLASTPRSFTFFPCPNVSLPLRSSDGVAPRSTTFLLCVGAPREVAFSCVATYPLLCGLQRSVPFTRSYPFPFPTGPSLFGPQLFGTLCEVASFRCPDVPFPLRSPDVSALHCVASFPCPDVSSLCGPSSWTPPAFFPTQRTLARPFSAVRRSHAKPRGPPHAVAFHTSPSLLLHHTPWDPTPRVLQRWLYQPCQQIRRQK